MLSASIGYGCGSKVSDGGASPSAGAGGTAGSSMSGGPPSVAGGPTNATGGSTPDGGGAYASSGVGGHAGGATAGASGAGGTGEGPSAVEVSGLPIPKLSGVPKPSGIPGNLTVLDWAGFKAAVSFTFDDSLSSQISNYPALEATGVHLTFYLVSNNNGSSDTWAHAGKVGQELGNHTADHCHDNGTGCFWGTYAGSLGAELDQCTAHIEEAFGVRVWTAASPYGDTGYGPADSTRFLLNRGVQSGSVGPNDDTDPFNLPCHVAAEGEVAGTFNSTTDAARAAGKWQVFLIHSLGGDGGYNPISINDAVSAINYAKASGDVWADSLVQIGAYWRAQKVLSTLAPTTSGNSRTWSWSLPAHFPPGHYLRVKVDGGTLSQGDPLPWSEHGYYEISLDAGRVTLSP